jgi:hypothetical protein
MTRDHDYYECPPDCDAPTCNYCMGGLAYCVVCKEAEAGLAKYCPGPKEQPDEPQPAPESIDAN